jgi:hypothetical protein
VDDDSRADLERDAGAKFPVFMDFIGHGQRISGS